MNIKIVFISIIIGLSLLSCQYESTLSEHFSCSNSSLSNLETVTEFQKNFSVKLPKNWKTELYSISNQSGIISADTSKVFSKSYTIDFSINNGSINLPEDLNKKINDLLRDKNLMEVKTSYHQFDKKEAFAHLSIGKDPENTTFSVFQYYIKLDEEKYILVKAEIHGGSLQQERLCEAISLINKIEILN